MVGGIGTEGLDSNDHLGDAIEIGDKPGSALRVLNGGPEA